MTLPTVIAAVLNARASSSSGASGRTLDRLIDERHARLVETTLRTLSAAGWTVRPEVSYSEWGERGSIDLLAWHGSTATLLVVEVKTELASVEETLRKHDEKVRLGPVVAARRLGWNPLTVSRLLVLPATRTTTRHLAAHAGVLDAVYPTRQGRPDGGGPSRPASSPGYCS